MDRRQARQTTRKTCRMVFNEHAPLTPRQGQGGQGQGERIMSTSANGVNVGVHFQPSTVQFYRDLRQYVACVWLDLWQNTLT